MIQSKTLYSLDKVGNPLQWTIEWDDTSNWYTMASGRVDGAITKTLPTYCTGKNKGKANETTDVSQCALEVTARIEKQRKKDFHDEIPTDKRFEVTLAKEFKARKRFIKFPMLVSAKLDGFRCYITKDGMFSRTHHKILSCPHIFESLKHVFEKFPNMVYDGELYSHEYKDDFNKIASLLSRTKNITPEFLEETKKVIRFHCFDSINLELPDKKYTDRCALMLYEFDDLKNTKFLTNFEDWTSKLNLEFDDKQADSAYNYITYVNQFEVHSFDEVEMCIDKALADGFEGVMLRNPNMLYDNGRSSNLIKYKKFQDAEYKIIDIFDGVGNAQGLASSILCETESGETFSAGLGKGFDETAKRRMFEEKDSYIGKMATIVFQDLTPDKQVPRFPKFKCVRSNDVY